MYYLSKNYRFCDINLPYSDTFFARNLSTASGNCWHNSTDECYNLMNDAIILHLVSNYVKTLNVKKVCNCMCRLNTATNAPQKWAQKVCQTPICRPKSRLFGRRNVNHFEALKRCGFLGFECLIRKVQIVNKSWIFKGFVDFALTRCQTGTPFAWRLLIEQMLHFCAAKFGVFPARWAGVKSGFCARINISPKRAALSVRNSSLSLDFWVYLRAFVTFLLPCAFQAHF